MPDYYDSFIFIFKINAMHGLIHPDLFSVPPGKLFTPEVCDSLFVDCQSKVNTPNIILPAACKPVFTQGCVFKFKIFAFNTNVFTRTNRWPHWHIHTHTAHLQMLWNCIRYTSVFSNITRGMWNHRITQCGWCLNRLWCSRGMNRFLPAGHNHTHTYTHLDPRRTLWVWAAQPITMLVTGMPRHAPWLQ